MKKPKINLSITKEDKGYSAFATINGNLIGTQGDNFEELKANVLEAVNLAFEDKDLVYTIDEIRFLI